MLHGLRTDLTAAVRCLFNNPAYSAFSVICLALGIGATTAVFTVVNAFLLRPLPFEEPSRLISIWMTLQGAEGNRYFVEPEGFSDLQRISEGFEIAGTLEVDFNTRLGSEARRVQGVYATPNLFELLGIPLLRGRSFGIEEERSEAKVCIISEEFWRGDLGGRSDVLGSSLHLNGIEYAVVGVAPHGGYPDQAQVWIPITKAVREGRSGFLAVARLHRGVGLQEAAQELDRSAEYLRQKDPVANANAGLAAGKLGESINQQGLEENLWALLAVVGFLLGIACANVASLLLVRLHKQQPELAIRAALGAGRSRLLRRVLAESTLLALLGGLLGIGLACAGTPALVALSPAQLTRFQEMGLDLRVLGFAAALALATLVSFSTLPAWRAARKSPSAALARGGRGSAASLSAFQRILAIADVSLALVLLAGAGLMLTSFWRLHSAPSGVDPQGLYRLRVVAPAGRAETHQGRTDFTQAVEKRIQAIPGVNAVGSSHSFPLGGTQYWASLLFEGRPAEEEEAELAVFQIVTPGYFEVMGLSPLQGRVLKESDFKGRQLAVVVTQAFVRQFWPDEDPLGKRLRPFRAANKDAWYSIVGVVADQKDRGLANEIGPSIYFPQQQFERAYAAKMDLFFRVRPGFEGAAATIRKSIHELEPAAIVYDLAPLAEVLSETLQRERFSAVLTAILAGLALTLAGAGIYGVISYSVSQRRGELGVRMAFGARAIDLKRLMVGQSMKGVLVGIAAGNLAALGLGRLIASQLYQTEPHDPLALAASSLLILATALMASYLPARRTSKLDPTEALRNMG